MTTEQATPLSYGATDEQLLLTGISEPDAKFILGAFEESHKYESWCSIHEDEALQARLSVDLVANMRDKQQELLDDLFKGLFGKLPPHNARKRHLKLRIGDGDPKATCVRWLCWRNRPIICTTTPITYTLGPRLFLRWYWRPTEYAISKIRGGKP